MYLPRAGKRSGATIVSSMQLLLSRLFLYSLYHSNNGVLGFMYRVRYVHSHISEELDSSVSTETEFYFKIQIRTCSVQEFLFLSLLSPLIPQNLCKFPI